MKILKKGLATIPVLALGVILGAALKTGADDMWGDDFHYFVKELLKNPRQVGAFTPCSRYAVEGLVKHVQPRKKKLRVLEVGSGTGVATSKIIEQLLGSDFSLDVIEINTDFCKSLHKRFGRHKEVNVHKIDILQWIPETKYDVIISALPFNNFSEQFVNDVLENYKKMIKPGGIISYIELAMPKRIRGWISGNANGEYKRKRDLIETFRDEHIYEQILVRKNIPPIYVYHLKM